MVNCAAINMVAQISLWDPDFKSSKYITRRGLMNHIVGLFFKFLTVFYSGCTTLLCYQQSREVQISRLPCQHLPIFFFFCFCCCYYFWKVMSREWAYKPQTEIKYFPRKHLIKNYCSKYTKTLKTQQWENKESNLKRAKDLHRHFIKEDIQMTSKHMKKWFTSFVIREVQTKTTMRYYCIPIRMAKLQNINTTKFWYGCRATAMLICC